MDELRGASVKVKIVGNLRRSKSACYEIWGTSCCDDVGLPIFLDEEATKSKS